MKENKKLIEILDQEIVRQIPKKRNYWFIRTYSGKLFQDFVDNSYVGIGFNEIPYNFIKEGKSSTSTFERLKEYLSTNYSLKKGEDTKWTNQLLRFEDDVKIGDIIVIPSDSSNSFAIGEVVSDTKVVSDSRSFMFNNNYERYPEKRKKIDWLKTIIRRDFIGDVRTMISSHQALSNINFMGDNIESNISTLFIRDEYAIFTLRINQNEDINAFDLNRLLNSLIYFYKEICKAYGVEENEELFIKIKLQSKGTQVLKSTFWRGVIALAIISQIPKSEGSKTEIGNWFKHESQGSEGLVSATLRFIQGLGEGFEHFVNFIDARNKLEAETVTTEELPESDIEIKAEDFDTSD